MGRSLHILSSPPEVTWIPNRLERQNSRSSAHSTRRVSPWDGPLARDNGITYRTGPVKPSPGNGDEESSSEEEWENAPVIPVQAFVMNAFNAPSISTASSETSTPHQVPIQLQHTPPPPAPPVIPGAPAQYALGMMTPAVAPGALPYAYAPQYLRSAYTSTPYQSPVMPSGVPLLRPLSRASYMGYQSQYIP